jgi:LuxR family transcriptional regulator, maltose regulon positive regulatory protein
LQADDRPGRTSQGEITPIGRGLLTLPTNLSAPEIARELSVSPNTVKTHIKHLYAKFGTHPRAEAVDLARALGLLAPARTSPASR